MALWIKTNVPGQNGYLQGKVEICWQKKQISNSFFFPEKYLEPIKPQTQYEVL